MIHSSETSLPQSKIFAEHVVEQQSDSRDAENHVRQAEEGELWDTLKASGETWFEASSLDGDQDLGLRYTEKVRDIKKYINVDMRWPAQPDKVLSRAVVRWRYLRNVWPGFWESTNVRYPRYSQTSHKKLFEPIVYVLTILKI